MVSRRTIMGVRMRPDMLPSVRVRYHVSAALHTAAHQLRRYVVHVGCHEAHYVALADNVDNSPVTHDGDAVQAESVLGVRQERKERRQCRVVRDEGRRVVLGEV